MIYPDDLATLMQQRPMPSRNTPMQPRPPLTPDEREALANLAATRMRARLASDHRLVELCDAQAERITRRTAA